MTTFDRGVLYAGVLVVVASAVVGLFYRAPVKYMAPVKRAYDAGPIYIATVVNYCTATEGAYYADPTNITEVQWISRDYQYKVKFLAGQDPAKPNSAVEDDYDVSAGASAKITIDPGAVHACLTYGQCTYFYEIVAVTGGCTMSSVGKFGIIVRP